jgi:hypothetical protein
MNATSSAVAKTIRIYDPSLGRDRTGRNTCPS